MEHRHNSIKQIETPRGMVVIEEFLVASKYFQGNFLAPNSI